MANIAEQMSSSLTKKQLALLRHAGSVADEMNIGVFMVGGSVRDVLIDRPITDIDLVVDGDAIRFARILAKKLGAKAKTHPRFGTATVTAGDIHVDLATVRSETYDRPGALPAVGPGSLQQDLARRDFSINAMAISINQGDYGRLIDSYNGLSDLDSGLIRVLHDSSFIDDATRILRAIRYEQRLGFSIENETESLINRDIAMLDTISGDRLRHELQLIIGEESPLKALRRADAQGVLQQIHPSLKIDDDLAAKLDDVFRSRTDDRFLYTIALLTYGLDEQYIKILKRLNIVGKAAQTIKEVHKIKNRLNTLSASDISNSDIYRFCIDYSTAAIEMVILAEEEPRALYRLKLYLDELQQIEPLLNGEDLIRMGITTGRKIGMVLKRLTDARLDGRVQSKGDEERLVKSIMRGDNP